MFDHQKRPESEALRKLYFDWHTFNARIHIKLVQQVSTQWAGRERMGKKYHTSLNTHQCQASNSCNWIWCASSLTGSEQNRSFNLTVQRVNASFVRDKRRYIQSEPWRNQKLHLNFITFYVHYLHRCLRISKRLVPLPRHCHSSRFRRASAPVK